MLFLELYWIYCLCPWASPLGSGNITRTTHALTYTHIYCHAPLYLGMVYSPIFNGSYFTLNCTCVRPLVTVLFELKKEDLASVKVPVAQKKLL